MKKVILTYISLILPLLTASAQVKTVQNRPYTDLRPFHFGVLLGIHLQDIELLNAGPQTVTLQDGTVATTDISADQDRWDPGFTVGVLGEFRLLTNFQFRIAPAMFFGTRHITFINRSSLDAEGQPTKQKQDLKTAYFSTAFDLIFSAPRFNNHRPYLLAGINPMLNLNGNSNDYLKLKSTNIYTEIGVGCDFYLPYFKLRPELKFMYGLGDNLDKKHADKLKDKNMLPYTLSVKEAHTKIIALTFYFE